MGRRRGQRRDSRHPRRARPRRRLTLDTASLAFGAAGAVWGFAADRLATRWPTHEEGAAGRRLDWRTVAVVLFGLGAGLLLPTRWSETRDLVLVGLYLTALTVLLATDLDQRILPDAITLPMIPLALAVLLFGWDPLLADRQLGLVSGLAAGVAFPLVLYAGSAILHGGLGLGDVKLLVSVGLVSGVSRLLGGLLVASVAFGALLVVLVATRRLGLRSFVPFGPVIIVAAAVAALSP